MCCAYSSSLRKPLASVSVVRPISAVRPRLASVEKVPP
jgi:hypothetical protein